MILFSHVTRWNLALGCIICDAIFLYENIFIIIEVNVKMNSSLRVKKELVLPRAVVITTVEQKITCLRLCLRLRNQLNGQRRLVLVAMLMAGRKERRNSQHHLQMMMMKLYSEKW